MPSTEGIISTLNTITQNLDDMYASIGEAEKTGAPIIVIPLVKILEAKSLSLIIKAYILANLLYIDACGKFDNKDQIAEGDGLVQAANKAKAVVIAGAIQLASIEYMAEIFERVNAKTEEAENEAMRTKAYLEALENSVAESPQKRPR